MNEKNIVICDREIRYADSLAANICERKELAVKVYVYSELEKVACFSQRSPIHLFLVDEGYDKEQRDAIEADQVFVLSKESDNMQVPTTVYKYQHADEMIRIVFETYMEKSNETILRTVRKKGAKLIGVYSPVHRIGKTSFAITLGKGLAQKGKVLYINMEEFAGTIEYGDEGLNLGDLLYYIKQGNSNLGVRLQSAIRQVDCLDYVPPIPIVLDLKEVTSEEWKEFLRQIMENSIYETIILDLSESIQGLFQLLEMCDRIYMPVLGEEVSEKKVKQYSRNIKKLGLETLWEITHQFIMPKDMEGYVKQLIKEEW